MDSNYGSNLNNQSDNDINHFLDKIGLDTVS